MIIPAERGESNQSRKIIPAGLIFRRIETFCPAQASYLKEGFHRLSRAYPHFPPHRMEQQEAGSESALKGNMEERAERLAQYIIENRTTVRAAAQKFGISKSTVHKDISERLPQFNRALYLQVKDVLEVNKAQRHIRGGIATRKKYRGE